MSIKIINNLSDDNHGHYISDLIAKSDEITIASPYLLHNFARFLELNSWTTDKKLHLITTLVPKSEDQIKKIQSLHNLVLHSIKNEITCEISINNRLHGKVYIFQKMGLYFAAIVTSANMTENGFVNLHEWGILISDHKSISDLREELFSAVEYLNIGYSDIINMYKRAMSYSSENNKPKQVNVNLDLIGMITDKHPIKLSDKVNYWLKPIGFNGGHVNPEESFGQATRNLHFSKDKPLDIAVNDILIAFAVGSGKILSVYRMSTLPLYTNEKDRWPWFVEGENLTQAYGSNWWRNSLIKEDLKAQFEKQYPNDSIKPNGAQTFGAFMWGKDRLKITAAFGKYIIGKVLEQQKNNNDL